MKVSACWIVKNEEKNLERSINSLNGVADELIVVDTGSTDGTVALAERLGARVEHFEWIGDFSAARNHAIQLASGEFIFFLDADEWFEPALTAQDRQQMERLFSDPRGYEAIQIKIVHVSQYGVPETSGNVDRIFRNAPHVRFGNRIHERLVHTGGRSLRKARVSDRWVVYHSGYQKEVMHDKMLRNITLLEEALARTEDGDEQFMQHVYLMRERQIEKRPDLALTHLFYIMRNPRRLKAACAEYGPTFCEFFYLGLELGYKQREQVSRKEIYRRLVLPMQREFPKYPGSATIELLYLVYFDFREDKLLRELPAAAERARTLPPDDLTKYKEVESQLHYCAARALWLRGRRMEAMDQAALACRDSVSDVPENLRILLGCVRGVPVGEVANFLTGLYDISNPEKAEFLVNNTRLEGWTDLHIYFIKKQIDLGYATKGTFLYLELLLGKYEESAAFARQMQGPENARAVADHIFLLSVVTGEERYFRENAELAGPYERLLEAFFSGRPLEEIAPEDLESLQKMYGLIAFAGGLPAAERLRALFARAPVQAYQVKAQYCINNELHDILLEESLAEIDERDADSRSLLIRAQILKGLHREALEGLSRLLAMGRLNDSLLALLLAVADSAPGEVGASARTLYDRYARLQDDIIDLRDVVATGAAFDDYTKKQMAALKAMTMEQLEKQLEEAAGLPFSSRLAELYPRAAAIYEEQAMYGPAVECYRWLLAHEQDQKLNRAKLAQMFRLLGNKWLAEKLENAG